FFFQAEDGIRDFHVTGVQTCALPILNNLSLMALIIAAGFVVDDAIVVLENTARHVERGEPPARAALAGAREVGSTVVSMSLSLRSEERRVGTGVGRRRRPTIRDDTCS